MRRNKKMYLSDFESRWLFSASKDKRAEILKIYRCNFKWIANNIRERSYLHFIIHFLEDNYGIKMKITNILYMISLCERYSRQYFEVMCSEEKQSAKNVHIIDLLRIHTSLASYLDHSQWSKKFRDSWNIFFC